jgi:hypothetical protein
MAPSRRTSLSLFAATVSGALVVAMAGTAPADDDLDADGMVCNSLPSWGSGNDPGESDEDEDEGTPVTTPAAAPDEDDSEDGAKGDRHCTDVATQARVQAAFTASRGR